MKKTITLLLAMSSLLLVACGGGGSREAEVIYAPDIHRFDVVDSYGVDSAKSNLTLAVNPYVDNGLFDIFWEVDSLEDYRVNILVNDARSASNSFLIHSEICGAGLACDQGGGVICHYTSDFTLSCNNSSRVADIGELFRQVPQPLYLVLEVCDTRGFSCDHDYRRVVME